MYAFFSKETKVEIMFLFLRQFYIRIKTYTDSRAEFWVNFEKGKVLDRKLFEGIFGSLKSVEHLLK